MPQKTQTNMKGHSPSKNIQRGVDKAWGAQQGYKTPQAALADKTTKNPVPVSGKK